MAFEGLAGGVSRSGGKAGREAVFWWEDRSKKPKLERADASKRRTLVQRRKKSLRVGAVYGGPRTSASLPFLCLGGAE